MTDFPSLPTLPLYIHTWTRWSAGWEAGWHHSTSPAAGTITWPVANTAIYCPVAIPWPYPVKRVFWANGTAITATNMDFGIYTSSGTLLYSTGSTAETPVSAVQYTTPTPFILTPGRYYFALACSTTTASCGGVGTTAMTLPRQRLSGMLAQAGALPLPATMTPVALANPCWPLCGVTRT